MKKIANVLGQLLILVLWQESFQIKSDIDHLIAVFAQILTLDILLGVGFRKFYGPLPYGAVVVIVEIMKIVIMIIIGILTFSHFVQILIIFDFR